MAVCSELRRAVPLMSELSRTDEIILNPNTLVCQAAGSVIQWYGLDTSSVIAEQARCWSSRSGNGKQCIHQRAK